MSHVKSTRPKSTAPATPFVAALDLAIIAKVKSITGQADRTSDAQDSPTPSEGSGAFFKPEKRSDWAYKTFAEGRPKTVSGTRTHKLKMKHEMWKPRFLADLLRDAVHPWNIYCNDPLRKLNRKDATLIAAQPRGTLFDVKVNYDHRTATVEEMFP